MKIRFTKMQGCGNDYVYVNGFTEHIPQEKKPEFVRFASDRHFGVGGDGVIFINPSDEADFEMEMYNADGTRAEMCGNGIRCVAKYAHDKGLTDRARFSIISGGKVKYMELTVENGVTKAIRVDMGEPVLAAAQIPVVSDKAEVIGVPVEVGGKTWEMTCVSMGNPHAVVFVPDTARLDLISYGPLFEHHEMFPKRVNTEFVQVLSREEINMRVWERGSGETLACGTGTCASVMACILTGRTGHRVLVHLLGGDLTIEYEEKSNHIFMTGPAVTVYEGEIETIR